MIRARLADADALFALVEQFATSYRPLRALFDVHLPVLLEAPRTDLRVAIEHGDVVGYSLAFDLLTLFANGVVTELQELMVAPEQRGRGIGRMLVESVIADARARGVVEITVPTRRAAEFYKRLGFEGTALYFKRRVSRG